MASAPLRLRAPLNVKELLMTPPGRPPYVMPAKRRLRVAVTGGRDYDSWHMVTHALRQMPEDAVLVHGAATGADRQCAEWWDMQGRQDEAHPADWTAECLPTCKEGHRRTRPDGSDYCPAEGHYRNQRMVDSGVDILIAFPGGRGTADMVRRCEAAGVQIIRMPS